MKTHVSILCFLFLFALQLSAQCPQSNVSGRYVVQQNENLYRIAMKHNCTILQLCEWNKMDVTDKLPLCKELIVAPPTVADAMPTSYDTNSYPTSTHTTPPLTAKGESNPPENTASNYEYAETYAPDAYNGIAYRKQSGNRHTVQSGETIAGLARLYGYTEERFREFNVLGNDDVLPGSILLSSDCLCDRVSYQDPSPIGYEGSSDKNINVPKTNPTPPTTTGDTGNDVVKMPTTVTGGNTTNTPATTNAPYMQAVERTMVDEINLMRANPAGYVKYINEYVQDQRNNNGFPVNDATIAELIQELNNTPPLSILQPTPCIYTAARKHGQDLLSMGRTDHVGSDGSWPWDRVLRECSNMTDGNENLVGGPDEVRESVVILLIDEGIPNRGHRKTLLRPDWTYAACYKIGKVGVMPNCWVQKFGK